ncbi:MAG: pyridoxamine 5'-phosphate oxidase family protein [Pseudomonadota bacterium]
MKTAGWSRKASPFHAGEQEVQERMGVRDRIEKLGRRVVRDYLPEQHREFYGLLPFLVIGTTDDEGRPWVSVLTGPPGFITTPDAHHLRIESQPLYGSPLAETLAIGTHVGILGILPENRRRNRSTGRIVGIDAAGLTIALDQTFGNCPQYIQTRAIDFLPTITAAPMASREIDDGDALDAAARQLIERSDTLFVATAYLPEEDQGESPEFGADASHRGGSPGFVRVEDDRTFVFPDFSGNFHFNTVGNIVRNPRAGFLFIDFESGDLLYVSGRAEIEWDGPQVSAYEGAERFIRLHVESWRRVRQSLPLRFEFGEYAPNLEGLGSWDQMDARLAADAERNAYLPYEVSRVEDESDVVRSIYLKRADGKPVAAHEPGQFLPIRVQPAGQETPAMRTYTVSDAANGSEYRLSVKRENDGLVSRFIHDELEPGSRIEAMAPRGKFKLDRDSDRAVVLVSAGVGITPMIAMANALIADGAGRAIHFVHGARDGASHAFAAHLRAQAEGNPGFHVHTAYSRPRPEDHLGTDYDHEGRVDVERLKRVLPFDDFDFYLCGPQAFMQDLHDDLVAMRVPAERIRYESFGPATVFDRSAPPAPKPVSATVPVKVRFARSGVDAEWQPDSGTLLDLAEAQGIDAPFSCRSGICGACATRATCGSVDYVEEPTADAADDEVLVCCSTPRAPEGDSCGDEQGLVLDL